MTRNRSSSGTKPLLVVGIVAATLASVVAVLAVVDEGSSQPTRSTAGSGYITTTRTLTPGPEQDENAYFAGMRENWAASWEKSSEAARDSVCERWIDDPVGMLNDSETPPDMPINIDALTYRLRLGDFFMVKCGTPNRPSPSPSTFRSN